ncbi:MAG TPA: hypothetical protein VJ396_06990 [Acidiferrobacterales bacterium]|nr:hypothetical protein [Acidiferrobacterales bacterium]
MSGGKFGNPKFEDKGALEHWKSPGVMNFKIRGEDRRRQERRERSVPEHLRRAYLERRKGSERRRQATRR